VILGQVRSVYFKFVQVMLG